MEQPQPQECANVAEQTGARILTINGQTIVVNGVMDSSVSSGQFISVLQSVAEPMEQTTLELQPEPTIVQAEPEGPEGGLLVYFDDESSELQSVQISADQAAALGLDGSGLLAPEPPPLGLPTQPALLEKSQVKPSQPVTLSICLQQPKAVRSQLVQIVPKQVSSANLLTVQPEAMEIRTGRTEKVIPRILATPTAAPPLVPFSKSVLKAKTIAAGPPVGSSENPIQLVQHGQTYHSVQPLNQEQLKQISSVLQQKQIETANNKKNILFDTATNTKIFYSVVLPDTQEEQIKSVGIVDKPMPRKRGRPSKTKKASDEEEYNEPDITKGEKEERKKLIPRTRSGRLSRPPRHMVKDYKRIHHLDFAEPDLDDSDGGYSDYQISDSETGPRQLVETQMSENNSPNINLQGQRAPKVYSSKFRCPTCLKIYLGTRRLTQHLEQFPDHGSVECVPVQLPTAKENLKKKKLTKTLRKTPLQETKTKIRNILSKCEPHQVAEIAGSVVAQSVDLWQLLLLKVSAKNEEGTRTEAVLRELDQLLEKARATLSSTILSKNSTEEFANNTEINISNTPAAAALNIPSGKFKISMLEDERICWQPEVTSEESQRASPLNLPLVDSATGMLVEAAPVPSFGLPPDLKLDKPLDGTLLSDSTPLDEIVTAELNNLVCKAGIEDFTPATSAIFDGQGLDMELKAGWETLTDHHALDQTGHEVDFEALSEEFNRNTQA